MCGEESIFVIVQKFVWRARSPTRGLLNAPSGAAAFVTSTFQNPSCEGSSNISCLGCKCVCVCQWSVALTANSFTKCIFKAVWVSLKRPDLNEWRRSVGRSNETHLKSCPDTVQTLGLLYIDCISACDAVLLDPRDIHYNNVFKWAFECVELHYLVTKTFHYNYY